MSVGEKTGGGIPVEAFYGGDGLESRRVAGGRLGARLRDVGGIGHVKRSEDLLLHDLVERLAFDLLDGALEVDVAFAGVAEACAGGEEDFERATVWAPV